MKKKPNQVWNQYLCPVINTIGDIVFFILKAIAYILIALTPILYVAGACYLVELICGVFGL